MSQARPHASYLRVLFALTAAGSTGACVIDASSGPVSGDEDTLPAASVKPYCPSGCHPQSVGLQSTPPDAGDASTLAP